MPTQLLTCSMVKHLSTVTNAINCDNPFLCYPTIDVSELVLCNPHVVHSMLTACAVSIINGNVVLIKLTFYSILYHLFCRVFPKLIKRTLTFQILV